jgi:hypothetical protein
MFGVLVELRFLVEGRPFLFPLAILQVIDIISALCLPITSRMRFLILEAAIDEVGAEVQYLRNLHGIHKLVSSADWFMAYQPIANVEPQALMVRRTCSKPAISAKGIRSES